MFNSCKSYVIYIKIYYRFGIYGKEKSAIKQMISLLIQNLELGIKILHSGSEYCTKTNKEN